MRIITVEDEYSALEHLTERVRNALPEAEILAFDNPIDALTSVHDGNTDIAFLGIDLGNINGILWASDYLIKPITQEKIAHALTYLRHNTIRNATQEKLYIRCFGEFEVFYDGEPVTVFTKRAKELLAYLVDKADALVPLLIFKMQFFSVMQILTSG